MGNRGLDLAIPQAKAGQPANDRAVAAQISDRLSQELIIALVGPVGSGVSTAANDIANILSGIYGYDVAPIMKPSSVIKAQAHLVSMAIGGDEGFATYISEMQDAGNKLREKFGENYLIEKIIEQIRLFRKARGGYAGDVEIPGRRAYIIDSLKNQSELELLRSIYGNTLCVIGVFAPDEIRKQRLHDAGYDTSEVRTVMSRDQGEVFTFGQATRKLFVESNFFVRNDRRKEDVRERVKRFIELIFDTDVHTPTRAESAMYEAESSSASSACMSRQVGASIVSAQGELIAVGWNDVPKFGGGLYSENDRAASVGNGAVVNKDHRCYNWKGGKCHNETRRIALIDDVAKAVGATGVIQQDGDAKVRDAVAKTDIRALIEYSRSIHAEMEAILSVAREGRHSLVGATLYTNTYPCHNCARHIVAAGIKEVVYIQPYLKSLATELHGDVITELPDSPNMVIFRQFDGVAPSSYLEVFRPRAPRKDGGKLQRPKPMEALPIFRQPLDGRQVYEDKVIAEVLAKEQEGEA